jgi:TetR/AcrR family transcriptional regulator, mexJK operon transcriptional repressor
MTSNTPRSIQRTRSPSTRRRGGRPSREAAEQIRERILNAATELLLTHGYGATSIEAIARRAHVAKRTFYDRFGDKTELTIAVVVRLIDTVRPAAEVPLVKGDGLHEILVHLGSLILRAALAPRVLALHRLIVAESSRFPDLATAIEQAGARAEGVTFISGLLRRYSQGASAGAEELNFAAEQFMQLIVATPQMRALGLGKAMSATELDAWVRRAVALFLDGFDHVPQPVVVG